MFRRILVANRGEIALRILRACREMEIETVAVFSKADEDALYLRMADEAVCIGPGPASESYLDISRVISAAEITNVEAIHPGYGFLAENAHFAEICRDSRIAFIGPTPQAMTRLGDKVQARRLAQECGVPIIPGSPGPVSPGDRAAVLQLAHEIGYPLMIKAASGGGGRGMRSVHNDASLINGLMAASAEAQAAFGDGSVYLERYITGARHVEIQVLADHHGQAIHLGERDCSLQRRHQKMIEESPSPVVDDRLRGELGEAALKLVRAAEYTNAGTIEFLVDSQGKFYFIEMNTRIQVEHPVTEMVTGVNIVKEQIRIAAGEPLRYRQEEVRLQGVAIECRINAEDPERNFAPCPGTIGLYFPPGGNHIRVDSHIYSGYRVPPYYDSLLGKLIVWRPTREQAVRTMRRALEEYVIEGVRTTIPFYLEVFGHTRFIRGNVDVQFIENTFKVLRRS
jgi:acetyl-CoA carboxylase biotin carboxylase subunit